MILVLCLHGGNKGVASVHNFRECAVDNPVGSRESGTNSAH